MPRYVNPLIPFQPNQPAVPSYIQDGYVFFVDIYGDPYWADETLCNTYGYIWNPNENTCRAFDYNPRINAIGENFSNLIKGSGNNLNTNVNNATVSGQNNLLLGNNTSVNIVGNQNQLENGISNSVVLGTFGNSQANNTLTIGGNSSQQNLDSKTGIPIFKDIVGERQITFAVYGGQSTDDKPLLLDLNNVANTAFPIPANCVFMFEIDILAVAVVGSKSVPVGSFMTFKSNGVTMKKTSGEGGTPIYSTTNVILSSGKLNWTANPIITILPKELSITVTGEPELTIEWVADIKITQIQTSVEL